MIEYVWTQPVTTDEILQYVRNLYCGQTVPEPLNKDTRIFELLLNSNEDIPGMTMYAIIGDIEDSRNITIPQELLTELHTVDEFCRAVNGIINRTNEQLMRVSPRLVARLLADVHVVDAKKLEAALGGTVKDFFAVYEKDEELSHGDFPENLWDAFASFANIFCLEIDEKDQSVMNSMDSMDSMEDVITFLDRKAAARRRNDSRVRYGNNWSCHLRNQTRSMLTQDAAYPKPYCMKHILGQHGQIIPEPENFHGFCVIAVPEQEQLVYHEYASLNDVIDDGWAVD